MFKKLLKLTISSIIFLSIGGAQAAVIVETGPWSLIGQSSFACHYQKKITVLNYSWYSYAVLPAKGNCPTTF
ncbi:hypothetical protein RHO12_03985 [Orbus sturtevantii]|uniref:hypothetical protein n=1 Tax=Orbus sturtevantii TaxID=3074109 RepID=UPI00370D204F